MARSIAVTHGVPARHVHLEWEPLGGFHPHTERLEPLVDDSSEHHPVLERLDAVPVRMGRAVRARQLRREAWRAGVGP